MAAHFFGLNNARDLLNKLGRDFEKLEDQPNVDSLFNFFVTAGSIKDWILVERPELKDRVDDLYNGRLLYCLEIGNKAKHLVLTKSRGRVGLPDPVTTVSDLSTLNGTAINDVAVGSTAYGWSLGYGEETHVPDLLEYAKEVVYTLVDFFGIHSISPSHHR